MNDRRKILRVAGKAFTDMLPLNLAVLPWGILCGSLAVQTGFSALEALLMPLLVFAGSVQLVTAELMAKNASLFTLLFTAFIISSRHFLYGLAFREKVKTLSGLKRVGVGFLLTDELFALTCQFKSFNKRLAFIYAMVAGASFYLSWLIWNILGIVAGSFLPDLTHLGLDFAIAVTFIALVTPAVTSLPVLVTVIVAGVSSVIFTLLHWQLALVLSAVTAMFFGYQTLRWQQTNKHQTATHHLVRQKHKKEQKISGDNNE